MALAAWLKFWARRTESPEHLLRGRLGEAAAKEFLRKEGLKFLAENFASRRGEIDLIFRDGECLVFVEVKTRTGDGWTRPERAVDKRKKQALARTAADYLRLLDDPRVPYRFDVVEVILQNDAVREIRHVPHSFTTENIWKRPRR